MTEATFEDVLVAHQLITREDVPGLQARVEATGKPLDVLLAEEKIIDEQSLSEAFAEHVGLPYRGLDNNRLNTDLFGSIPLDVMRRHPFLPLGMHGEKITVAVPDPLDVPGLDRIETLLGHPLDVVVATRSAIQHALARAEGNSQLMAQAEAEFRPSLVREDDHGEEVISVEKINKDQSPIVKLVDTIILTALQKRASDIHIEPAESIVDIKYRIDGVLYAAMEPLDIKVHSPLTSRLKVMSELDIAERRTPQDGRFKLRIDRRTVDFRISVLPSTFGESIVIRVLEKEGLLTGVQRLTLEELRFNEADLTRVRRAILKPYGMVLVTGPTGSGKTTTLYAAINEINTHEDKIITIEDPVEYQLKGIVQIPVNEKKGLTFAKGLRSILRHDPDKIMVGEIRDMETAQIAIQSALTGHLVFTTVHANNAFDVIGRFVNMGIEPYNFVSSLNCILAQRLVRAICINCKSMVTPDAAMCEESGLRYDDVKDRPFYEGSGCAQCHGLGYRGRLAITEFLELTDPIKDMILNRTPSSELQKVAIAGGMTTLRQAGLQKVFQGHTTLREVNRVTFVN